MQNFDLEQLSSSTIVIVAPHMDDEALACGGLIAKLPDKSRVHLIYATDGMKSPAPIIAGRDQISPDLGKVRMQESMHAMNMLGVSAQDLHFLCLPEAQLQKHMQALQTLISEKIRSIAPQFVFVPFRYDRHPDHLAVNHVVAGEIQRGGLHVQLIEYFVYYRWRLMPRRDIRKYVKSQYMYSLDISDVATLKREALDCFTSQTTIYYPWMTRPILTPRLLDEECQNPEYFMRCPGSLSGTDIFSGAVPWIQLAHRLEPVLLRWKYLMLSRLKRVFQNRAQ